MKVIYNNIIPFEGYKAVNLFGVLFVRAGSTMSEEELNHERIHTAQMKEMLYVPFYIWYCVEYLIKRWSRTQSEAYEAIGFEREAYDNQDNLTYLESRRHYAWRAYLSKDKPDEKEGGEG